MVQIATGINEHYQTDRPLEMLAQWLKLDAGEKENRDGFYEPVARQKEDGNDRGNDT
jgi:hypothetical protein